MDEEIKKVVTEALEWIFSCTDEKVCKELVDTFHKFLLDEIDIDPTEFDLYCHGRMYAIHH